MPPLPNVESVARVLEIMDNDDRQQTSSTSENSKDHRVTGDNSSRADLNLRLESDRLKTFENWPLSFVRPRDLAAAGFYYHDKKSDIVKCPYCNIEVGRWKRGDKPFSEHESYSPRCRFVLEKKESNPETALDESPSAVAGEDTCGPHGVGGSSWTIRTPAGESERTAVLEPLQQVEINLSETPLHPSYSTYEERLKTYENWSGKIPPDELSMAGFVFSGSGDRTYCFHCGGTLHDWDEVDDPWTEHAHWFSKCQFVLKTRGKNFVDDAHVRRGLTRTEEEMRNAIERIRIMVASNGENESSPKNCKEASSEGSNNSDESSNIQDAAESSSNRETRMCLICMIEERNTILLPCYHVVACTKCVTKLTNCCVCREKIIYRRRIYIP